MRWWPLPLMAQEGVAAEDGAVVDETPEIDEEIVVEINEFVRDRNDARFDPCGGRLNDALDQRIEDIRNAVDLETGEVGFDRVGKTGEAAVQFLEEIVFVDINQIA